jgi:hypothetical protein
MGRKVGIVGAAITPCKSHWVERTYYGLSQMAVKDCVRDAAIGIKDVDAVVYGIYNDIFELAAIPEHPLQGIITWPINRGSVSPMAVQRGPMRCTAPMLGSRVGSMTPYWCWVSNGRPIALISSQ